MCDTNKVVFIMGKYLNNLPTGSLPAKGKADALLLITGTEEINEPPTTIADIPKGKALICVVDSGYFEAAAYMYKDAELADFTLPEDYRPKRWILVPDYVAALAG